MKSKYPRTFVRDRKDTIKSTWDTFEADVQLPHPRGGRIKFPTPGKAKASNARGMPGGGMLKLRFDWYISERAGCENIWLEVMAYR